MMGEFVAYDSKPSFESLNQEAMTDLGRPDLRSALGGEADMDRRAKPFGSVENDPTATSPIQIAAMQSDPFADRFRAFV
jgi:hypothetical protein